MPTGRAVRAGIIALALLLAGCAGGVIGGPSQSAQPSAASTPARPPLADDLTGGTPLRLGSAGHWAIGAGHAFVAASDGTVSAIDLTTGATTWRSSFRQGKPWDAQPTLGLSANQSTVVAVRTVDSGGTPRLDLLVLDAATGATAAEHLVEDPARAWRVDLPPRVLAADADTVVLADDPESGRQTGVVRIADGRLAWRVDDQAVAASPGTVVTRGAGWARVDGVRRWQAAAPLGPLLAQRADAIVVRMGSAAIWLDPAVGLELARTDELGEAEPPCAAASDVVVCLTAGVTGYDLANGTQRWSSSARAVSIAIVADWAYLWRRDGHGDVLDARTGQVLAADVALPPIRYADGTGILLGAENGYTWVPLPR